MCFPQSPTCVRRSSSCGAGVAAAAVERAAWRKLLPPHLLQKSRKGLNRLREWGRSRVKEAGNLVSDWVVSLHVNFTLLSLPTVFAIFLAILHPHRDIQACVCGTVLVCILFFLILNGSKGFMDHVPDTTTVRIGVYRLFKRTGKIQPEDEEETVGPSLSIRMKTYRALPLNRISRIWGRIADARLPPPFNLLSVWLFATVLKCDRREAEFENLSEYPTISQFFRRRLKPGSRPIDEDSPLVSPADGAITYAGRVQGSHLEQVKGIRYSLKLFFGNLNDILSSMDTRKDIQLISRLSFNDTFESGCFEYQETVNMVTESQDIFPLLCHPGGNILYQAVVYLSPSDYHRFHSPTTWTIHKRRHFPGKLYSVAPNIVKKMPGLFHTNERVAFFGRWQHGFFSLTAVGATNVGSIVVNFDADLATNARGREYRERQYFGGIEMGKGEEMGYFNFGSTIVLVFEAPVNFQFGREFMDRVRVGEAL